MTTTTTSQQQSQQPLLLALSLACVVAGCIWNSFELEHVVTAHRDFGYSLTMLQCAFNAVVAGAHFAALRALGACCCAVDASAGKAGAATGIHDAATTRARGRSATPSSSARERSASVVASVIASVSWCPGGARWPLALSLRYAALVALLFWITNVLNNLVFAFGIAVPIQIVVRSSSLLVSALMSVWLHGRRFSAAQVGLLVAISAGIATLSLLAAPPSTTTAAANATTKSNATAATGGECCAGSATSSSDLSSSVLASTSASAVARWTLGVAVLALSTVLGAVLGMCQDLMFREADARAGGAGTILQRTAGVTEEAIFLSHSFSVVFFVVAASVSGVAAGDGGGDGGGVGGLEAALAPFSELAVMAPSMQLHVLWNLVSQYLCVWGVFTLAKVSSAFHMTMATTVRKFLSLVLSLAYFDHAKRMTWGQLAAMSVVTVAVTAYPFVRGAASSAPAPAAAAAAAAVATSATMSSARGAATTAVRARTRSADASSGKNKRT